MPVSDPIFEAAARVAKQRAETEAANIRTQTQVSQSLAEIENAGTDQAYNIDSMQKATTTIVAAKDAMVADTQAATARAKLELGTDSKAGNYRLAKLANDRETNYDAAVQAEQIIFDKKKTTFASDPLGWIHAQITLPADVDVYNHFANRHNMAEQEYNSIVQSTTETARMNEATAVTTNAAMADANLQLVKAKAEDQRFNLKKEFAQFNITGAQALQGLSQQQLTNAHSALTEQEALGNFKLRQANMAAAAASREEANARRRLSDEQRIALGEQKAGIIADQNAQLGFFNKAVEKVGGVAMDLPTFLQKARSDKTGYVANLARYGQDLQDAETAGQGADGIPMLGVGMSAADLPGLLRVARARPKAIDKDVYEFTAKTEQEYTLAKGATLPKDPAVRAAEISKYVEDKAVLQYKAIDPTSPNIYSAPTPKQLTESIPIMAKYPAIADVIKRSVDNPDVPIKDIDIINAARTALAKDPSKGNFKAIADSLEAYYVGVTTYNNVHKQYLEKGLPQQQDYNAVVPLGMFGKNQTINMRKPLEIKKLLASSLVGRDVALQYATDLPAISDMFGN